MKNFIGCSSVCGSLKCKPHRPVCVMYVLLCLAQHTDEQRAEAGMENTNDGHI